MDSSVLRIWNGLPTVVEWRQTHAITGLEAPATNDGVSADIANDSKSAEAPQENTDGNDDTAAASSSPDARPASSREVIPTEGVTVPLNEVMDLIRAVFCCAHPNATTEDINGAAQSMKTKLDTLKGAKETPSEEDQYSMHNISTLLGWCAAQWAGVPPSGKSVAASASIFQSRTHVSAAPSSAGEGPHIGGSAADALSSDRSIFLKEVADCILSDEEPNALVSLDRVLIMGTNAKLLLTPFKDFFSINPLRKYDEVYDFLWSLLHAIPDDTKLPDSPASAQGSKKVLTFPQFARFVSWIYVNIVSSGSKRGRHASRECGVQAARRIWYECINSKGEMTMCEFQLAAAHVARKFARSLSTEAFLRVLRMTTMHHFVGRTDFSASAFFNTLVNRTDLFPTSSDANEKQVTDLYLADELDDVKYCEEALFRAEPMSRNRIVVAGESCVGKTTVARLLAARLNSVHIDVHELAFAAAQHVGDAKGWLPSSIGRLTPTGGVDSIDDAGNANVDQDAVDQLEDIADAVRRIPRNKPSTRRTAANDEDKRLGSLVHKCVMDGIAIPIELQSRLVACCLSQEKTRFRGFVLGDIPSVCLPHEELTTQFLHTCGLEENQPTVFVDVCCPIEALHSEYAALARKERAEALSRNATACAEILQKEADRKKEMADLEVIVNRWEMAKESPSDDMLPEEAQALEADARSALEKLTSMRAGTTGGPSDETLPDEEDEPRNAAGNDVNLPNETEMGKNWFSAALEHLIRMGRLLQCHRQIPPTSSEKSAAATMAALRERAEGLRQVATVSSASSADGIVSYVMRSLKLHPSVLPILPEAASQGDSEDVNGDDAQQNAWASFVARGYRPSPIWKKYCPVTYAENDNILMEGDQLYVCAYRGYIYSFTSGKNRDVFSENPLRYLCTDSRAGVVDPVLLITRTSTLLSDKSNINSSNLLGAVSEKLRLPTMSVNEFAALWETHRTLVKDRAAAYAMRKKAEQKERSAREERRQRLKAESPEAVAAKAAPTKGRKGKVTLEAPDAAAAKDGAGEGGGATKGKEGIGFRGKEPRGATRQPNVRLVESDPTAGPNQNSVDEPITQRIRLLQEKRQTQIPLLISSLTGDVKAGVANLQQLFRDGVLPRTVVILEPSDGASPAGEDDDGASGAEGEAEEPAEGEAGEEQNTEQQSQNANQQRMKYEDHVRAFVEDLQAAQSGNEGTDSSVRVVTIGVDGKSLNDIAEEIHMQLVWSVIRTTEPGAGDGDADAANNVDLPSDFEEDLLDTDSEAQMEDLKTRLQEEAENEEQELIETVEALFADNGANVEDDEVKEQISQQVRDLPRKDRLLRPRRRAAQSLGITLRYCPVALLTKKLLIRGLVENSLIYKGKRYVFSSSAAKEEFQRNPLKYTSCAPPVVPPRLWMLGVKCSGKRTIARYLYDNYGVSAFFFDISFFERVVKAASSTERPFTLIDGVRIPGSQHSNPSVLEATRIVKELHEFADKQEKGQKLKEDTEKEQQQREEMLEARRAAAEENGEDFDDEMPSVSSEAEARIQEILEFEPEEEEDKVVRLKDAHLKLMALLTRIEPFESSGYAVVGPQVTEEDIDVLFEAHAIPEAVIHLKVSRDAYVGRRVEQFNEQIEQRARAKQKEVNYVVEARAESENTNSSPSPHLGHNIKSRLAALKKWRRRNIGSGEQDAKDSENDEQGDEGAVGAGQGKGRSSDSPSDGDDASAHTDVNAFRSGLDDACAEETEKVDALIAAFKGKSIPIVRVVADHGPDIVYRTVSEKLCERLEFRRSMLAAPEVVSADAAKRMLEDGVKVLSSFSYSDPVELFRARRGAVDMPHATLNAVGAGEEESQYFGIPEEGSSRAVNEKDGGVAQANSDRNAREENDENSEDVDARPEASGGEGDNGGGDDEEELSEEEEDTSEERISEMRDLQNRVAALLRDKATQRIAALGNRLYFFNSDDTLRSFLLNSLQFWDQPPPLPHAQSTVAIVNETRTLLSSEDGTVVTSAPGGGAGSLVSNSPPIATLLSANMKCPLISLTTLLMWAVNQPRLLSLRQQVIDLMTTSASVPISRELIANLLELRLADTDILSGGAVLSNLPRDAGTLQRLLSNSSSTSSPIQCMFTCHTEHELHDGKAQGASGGGESGAKFLPSNTILFGDEMDTLFHDTVAVPKSISSGSGNDAGLPAQRCDIAAQVSLAYGQMRDNYHQRQLWIEGSEFGYPIKMCNTSMRTESIAASLSTYGWFCCVTWVAERKLSEFPGERVRIVQYLGKNYVFANDEYMNVFFRNPEYFASSESAGTFPANKLPQRVAVAKDEAEGSAEFSGCCPVTLYGTRHLIGMLGASEPRAVLGSPAYAVRYDDKLYLCETEAKQSLFMREPWVFAEGAYLPPVHRMPLKPGALKQLREEEYVRRTLYDNVVRAMMSAAELRLKYPGCSLEESALKYVALYLKANNPSNSDFMKSQFQANLLTFTKRATAYQTVRPESSTKGRKSTTSLQEASTKKHKTLGWFDQSNAASSINSEACDAWREAAADEKGAGLKALIHLQAEHSTHQ